MLFVIDCGNINMVFLVWDGFEFVVMWWMFIEW